MNNYWTKIRDFTEEYAPQIIMAAVVVVSVGAAVAVNNDNALDEPSSDIPRDSGTIPLEEDNTSINYELEKSGPYTVQSVVDGDTVNVNIDGAVEPVRLIGIDTPEVDGPYTDEECYGSEASNRATELLDGQQVHLKSDSSQDNRDAYDRLLRYVILDDTNVNQLLIEEGYGFEYTFEEVYYHQDKFRRAERKARDDSRGLWDNNACGSETTLQEGNVADTTPGEGAPDGCILYDKAPNYVGTYACVTGVVDHVFVSRTNTTFINFCSNYRTCPFYSVIFDSDRYRFSNVEQLEGKQVNITGTIDTHEGRPQIILNDPSQLAIQ